MIDFHTHILPGMDDGSSSVETSLAMLREEYRQGIDTVIMTPHFYAGENSPADFLERREQAWQLLAPLLQADMPRVYLGAEVQYFEGISGVEEILDLHIEGSNLLLLEMPFCRWTDRMIQDVLELNGWGGMQVVLAHIERYMPMQPKSVWKYLHDHGIWMQSNVSYFGTWKTRHKATKMVSRGEIQFVGSDCHNMRSRCPNWDRFPKKAAALLEQGVPYRRFAKMLARSTEEEEWNLSDDEIGV